MAEQDGSWATRPKQCHQDSPEGMFRKHKSQHLNRCDASGPAKKGKVRGVLATGGGRGIRTPEGY